MRIGIDIGGSHIGIGLINDKKDIVYKKEKDIYISEDKKELTPKIITECVVGLITETCQINKIHVDNIERIGLAIPGTVDDKRIIRAENLFMENYNIVEELKEHFNVPICLRNDTKCAAVAEKECGRFKNI